jgi:tight adherence protein B
VNTPTVAFILMTIVLVLLAIGLLRHSKETRLRERMKHHFREVLPYESSVSGISPGARQTYWQQFKVRASIFAGFELQTKHVIVIPVAFVFTGMLGWVVYGLVGAVLIFSITIFIFGFLLPYSRLRRRQAQTISQIPLFIDQVLRSLSTGRSLESAIRFATDEAQQPLRFVLERVIRAADLGADMVENLTEAAKLHRLRELNLIALAMRISNNYGSSPRDMLESVVKMVRQQELARRELSAMTGETRISAWVLGLTPVAIAAYIMVVNPNYLNMLLQDTTGKTMAIAALILQGSGAFILWRMLRSV